MDKKEEVVKKEEKKNVEHFLQKEVQVSSVEYSSENKPVPTDDKKAVSKVVVSKKGDKETTSYYLKSYAGRLYDPYATVLSNEGNIDAKKSGVYIWKYKEVSFETFSTYREFLKRRNGRLFNEAQRMFNLEVK